MQFCYLCDCLFCYQGQVWKFLDYKINRDAHVEDSALIKRRHNQKAAAYAD